MSKLQNGQQNTPEIIRPASPWIWTEDALPPMGVKVIFADADDARQTITTIGTTVREDDWGMGTDEPCRCYWMHIPALPEGGHAARQKQPEARMDVGGGGGLLTDKIVAIMQQWTGANGGVYAIRGCAMEIARELQRADASSDEQAAFTTWAEIEYRNEASYTARDYRMGLEAWRERARVDRSPNLQSSAVDESTEMQSRGQPADQDVTPEGDIVGWLRRRADQGICAMTPGLARSIADHIEALQKEAQP